MSDFGALVWCSLSLEGIGLSLNVGHRAPARAEVMGMRSGHRHAHNTASASKTTRKWMRSQAGASQRLYGVLTGDCLQRFRMLADYRFDIGRLLPDDLHQHPLPSVSVELPVEDLLPLAAASRGRVGKQARALLGCRSPSGLHVPPL